MKTKARNSGFVSSNALLILYIQKKGKTVLCDIIGSIRFTKCRQLSLTLACRLLCPLWCLALSGRGDHASRVFGHPEKNSFRKFDVKSRQFFSLSNHFSLLNNTCLEKLTLLSNSPRTAVLPVGLWTKQKTKQNKKQKEKKRKHARKYLCSVRTLQVPSPVDTPSPCIRP